MLCITSLVEYVARSTWAPFSVNELAELAQYRVLLNMSIGIEVNLLIYMVDEGERGWSERWAHLKMQTIENFMYDL